MRMKLLKRSFVGKPLLLLLLLVTCAFQGSGTFEKVSLEMNTRKVQNGNMAQMKANIYYSKSGKMVTHLFYPTESVIITNDKGEVTLYDPRSNSVKLLQNKAFNTESTNLYYFLQDATSSLGLRGLGFALESSSKENDVLVTYWLPPMNARQQMGKVKLVYQNTLPIYMEHTDAKGKVLKKSYFYNFTQVAEKKLPLVITNIHFGAGKDSIVEKTSYSNIKVNNNASSPYFDFVIPPDAKNMK